MSYIKDLKNRILKIALSLVFFTLGSFFSLLRVDAETNTLQEFTDTYSQVSLSPDGAAWTIKGTGTAEKQGKHTFLQVGESKRNTLQRGQHYYSYKAMENVDIAYWEVMHPHATCCHGHDYVGEEKYGMIIEGDICYKQYDNGWFPICADCHDYVFEIIVYANSEQLKSINTLVGKGQYYYLCPFSGSLEVGADYEHTCKGISSNRYTVTYMPNAPEGTMYKGFTAKTYHMFNNDPMYNGQPSTYKDTHLRKNGYSVEGYRFIGWNDKADGSGNAYKDEQEVLNLSELTVDDRNNENVILFAQWEKVDTILKIDGNGGTYDSLEEYYVKQSYGSFYTLDKDKVVAPSGYTITFNSHGGTACGDKTTEKEFAYWEKQPGFEGLMVGNIYYFKSMTNGHEDVIKVQYANRTITLPNTTQTNLSFAGWYYDADYTEFCGRAGDEVAFDKALELHAKWMPLTLYSQQVYDSTVNEGKGAVNLWWEQKDNSRKVYKLYQSMDKINWSSILSTSAIVNIQAVNETFGYKDGGAKYVIPETGYYELTAYGAKGADYSAVYKGGNGGKATAVYWFKKGDVITTFAGLSGNGQSGGINGAYANGGTATSADARGGGAGTEVYVTRGSDVTLLLLAGGGGGANVNSHGGNGGEAAATVINPAGDSTDYGGGGGGYPGGAKVSAGVVSGNSAYAYHYTGAMQSFCAPYTATYTLEVWGAQGQSVMSGLNGAAGGLGGYSKGTMELSQGDVLYIGVGGSNGYNGGGAGGSGYGSEPDGGFGGGATHIGTQNNPLAEYDNLADLFIVAGGGGGGAKSVGEAGAGGGESGICGYTYDRVNQIQPGTQFTGYAFGQGANGINGQNKFWSAAGSGGGGGGLYGGYAPAGQGTVYGEKLTGTGAGGSGYIEGVANGYTKSGERSGNGYALISCEYVESFYMSGGNSYICREYNAKNLAYTPGANAGDGYVTIRSKSIGYIEENSKDGVTAPDMAAPYPVDKDTVSVAIAGIRGGDITYNISFLSPSDRGTAYFHKVESYLLSSEDLLSASNITEDLIMTRYKGIHYYVDENQTGQVNVSHELCTTKNITYKGEKGKKYYLHMAAVDNAGNISETTNIELSLEESDGILIENFIPVTDSISIRVADDNENAARSPLYFHNNCYYVKADGKTNFTLNGAAHIKDNMERENYQVNTIQFNLTKSLTDSVTEWVKGRVCNGVNRTYGNADIAMECHYPEQHIRMASAWASRNHQSQLTLNQDISFLENASSSIFLIYPKAYAEYEEDGVMKELVSNDSDDRTKYVTIITDSVAPEIDGLEVLTTCNPMEMEAEFESYIVTAWDVTSGLGDFEIRIDNRDNYFSRTIKDEDDGAKDGVITITVPAYNEDRPEGLEFCGDYVITAYVADNVGNERIERYDTENVSVNANLSRILEPHEPIFKQGESGILEIDTWGYVEAVEIEFPLALSVLNGKYEYGILTYNQKELLEFMIPLDFPEGDYFVKVTGYKAGTNLEMQPRLLAFTVRGSVLDELRTRLR